MDKKGLSRKSFKEILKDAEKQFETLDKDTQQIEIRTIISTRETTKKLNQATHSPKDIKVLEALSHRSNETFQSMSIQEEIGLTRSMVYYRLSQKFDWLLEKTGRKWTLKKGSIQIITYFLKMIGEIEFLISGMEKTLITTFGIRGIKTTIETQTERQELQRIQDYDSP